MQPSNTVISGEMYSTSVRFLRSGISLTKQRPIYQPAGHDNEAFFAKARRRRRVMGAARAAPTNQRGGRLYCVSFRPINARRFAHIRHNAGFVFVGHLACVDGYLLRGGVGRPG